MIANWRVGEGWMDILGAEAGVLVGSLPAVDTCVWEK